MMLQTNSCFSLNNITGIIDGINLAHFYYIYTLFQPLYIYNYISTIIFIIMSNKVLLFTYGKSKTIYYYNIIIIINMIEQNGMLASSNNKKKIKIGSKL